MMLIGSGALLARAMLFARRHELRVDYVCCPPSDYASKVAERCGIRQLETEDLNRDLPSLLTSSSDGVAFSINNTQILADDVLGAGVSFYNIHSGLVQKYRGVAEVCIFAAICNAERTYGVTLHQILPRQRVDAGPVLAQIEFDLSDSDCFATVLTRCLYACEAAFESNVERILGGDYQAKAVEPSQAAYSYRHVAELAEHADIARYVRAADLGLYAGKFPKLAALLAKRAP